MHGITRSLRPVEAVQHFVGTFDDVRHHVTLVRHAHVRHGVTAHQSVLANESGHTGEHLIAARPVMGVQQDDFVGLAAVGLAGAAQPEHVLSVVAAVVLPHTRPRHHERLETFAAKFAQHGCGGDVAVLANASPVRDERVANLAQRGPAGCYSRETPAGTDPPLQREAKAIACNSRPRSQGICELMLNQQNGRIVRP